MKTEGLFDINREPAKISCVLKVAQGALKEHNKSRILTAQRHAIESYVLASPGDLVTLHIEADPHIADSFDVYCDGILRFTQPNTDHTRKFKPDVKKVYYQGPVTGKKSDGPKLYSMMVQLREKSRDLDTTDNASSAVGSIVVKCWQKKTEGLFVGHATDPSVPNFSTHSEWHNLTSNVGTDSSLPALQIGFVNGRNVTKPKPGTKPSDVVDEAAKRDDSTYELIHELIFHVRTITELRGLGFADGSDQSNAPESKPVKKSKKVVVIAEEDDAEGDADIEEIDCSGPIPPLPPALLHQIVHHLHAPDSGGVDIPETEFREVEQEAIIPTAPSDVQNSEVQPSEVAIDEPVQTVEAEHVSQLREQTVDFQEATIPTPPTDTLNSKVQLSEPAIIEPGLSVESEHVSPLKEQSAEIQNTMDAEEEHRTQQVETDAKDEGTLSELDPVPAPAEAGASILDSEAPKSSQATTTSKDRILKGLPNGPATEAFRKKAAAYAVAVQSTDEYNEEPIAVDTSPEIGAIASRILASVLLTPPNPAEKPGFIDIFDRLLPKTLSQATTLSYVESLGRVDTTMVDGLNFSRFPLDLQGGSMIVGDDAMTDIAPEEDILRAVEVSRGSGNYSLVSNLSATAKTEEASPSFRVSDVAADEAMQSIESSVLASAVTLIREEPLRQDARAISSPPDLRTVTPASHSGRSSQLDTQHLTPVFTEKCESSLSDKPQSRDPVIRRLFSDAAYASPKRLGEQSASNARPQKSQKLGNSRSSSLSSVQSSTSHTSFKRPAEEPALNDRQPKSRKLSEPSRLSVSQLLAANAPPNLAATGSAVTNTTTDVPAGSEPEHARAKSSVDTTQESSLKTSLSQSFTSTQVPTQAAATSKVPAFQLLQSQETKVASSVDTTQLNQSAATCALLQILVQGSTANKLQVSPQLPAQESKVKTANNRGLTLEQLQAQASAVEAKRREEEVKLEETQQRLTAMKHIREKREACERLRIQREQVEREIMDMESS